MLEDTSSRLPPASNSAPVSDATIPGRSSPIAITAKCGRLAALAVRPAIVPFAAPIPARSAVERVDTGAAGEVVGALAPGEDVGPRPAVERVGLRTAVQAIGAAPAVELIEARPPDQDVAAVAALEHVVAHPAAD